MGMKVLWLKKLTAGPSNTAGQWKTQEMTWQCSITQFKLVRLIVFLKRHSHYFPLSCICLSVLLSLCFTINVAKWHSSVWESASLSDCLADPGTKGLAIRESPWHPGADKKGLPGFIFSVCNYSSFMYQHSSLAYNRTERCCEFQGLQYLPFLMLHLKSSLARPFQQWSFNCFARISIAIITTFQECKMKKKTQRKVYILKAYLWGKGTLIKKKL